MKRSLLYISFLVLVTATGYAQSDSLKAGYQRFPTIPPFTLLKPDSTKLTRDDLPKNKKTLIMYFSPSCDHCKHQTDSMLANIDKLNDVEILMATYQPLEDMAAFYKDYNIARYPNIKMGRDITFFFPPFYKMVNLPFIALYNEKGKLLTTFEGTTKIEKILQAFKGKAYASAEQ